ncbi:MAG: glycosyltransferase family 4 protein [Gammaproteobacteria bacterium]|nr:glycosyltransferase family 4 protein [Gammaproteobacteria bacterium]
MTQRSILFISKGEDSASTRYRAFTYFPYLQDAGWRTEHLTASQGPLQRLKILRRASQVDVVVIIRKTLSPLFLQLLRKASRRLVFDFDDAIFVRSNGEPSKRRAQGFHRTMQVCDAVWAGNNYLAEAAARINGHVTLLPTSIQPDKYDIIVDKPRDRLDLVWIGSHSTRKYLVQAVPALEALAQRHPTLCLKIIADFDLESLQLTTLPVAWNEATEAQELASSHIGIAPMPDDPWTRGKCALKVLQYMAAGLPVVASPTGVNKDVVTDGETGYLVETETQWSSRLEELIRDPGLRERLGRQGRQRVADGYSEFSTARKMLADLDGLV